MDQFSADNLHGTVVASIQGEVEEENRQKIVWGTWSAGDAEEETEDHVDDSYHDQAGQSRFWFAIFVPRWLIIFFNKQILYLFSEDLDHHEKYFVIIFDDTNVEGMDRHYYNDDQVNKAEEYPEERPTVINRKSFQE